MKYKISIHWKSQPVYPEEFIVSTYDLGLEANKGRFCILNLISGNIQVIPHTEISSIYIVEIK